MPDTPFLSATEHALAVRNRHVTSTQLTDLYIGRIHQHNPALQAVVVGNEGAARQTARERDEDLKHDVVRGPLHGVAVTVKEAFNVAGSRRPSTFPNSRTTAPPRTH
jgi:amidase